MLYVCVCVYASMHVCAPMYSLTYVQRPEDSLLKSVLSFHDVGFQRLISGHGANTLTC